MGLKHILDRAILGAFHQLFHLVWVILAHQRKTDASQNCWRLLSAIFRRASFDHQNRITLRKTIASQFLWNQKWFQVTCYSASLKPKWFHRLFVILVVFFFLWLGFMTPKKLFFGLKITISGVSNFTALDDLPRGFQTCKAI